MTSFSRLFPILMDHVIRMCPVGRRSFPSIVLELYVKKVLFGFYHGPHSLSLGRVIPVLRTCCLGSCWLVNPLECPRCNLTLAAYAEGRERPKRQATADWQRVLLISKGIYIYKACRECLQDEQICAPTHQILKVCIGLSWVQSCMQSRWSQHHITISSQCPRISLWEWGRQVDPTLKGEGKG